MASTWIDVAPPRPLTAKESTVLQALVEHAACPPLTRQLSSVRVSGKCACGCSSVRLSTTGPPVPPAAVAAFSATGRQDWFAVHATGDGTDVVVHVVQGRLFELELYAGDSVPAQPPARPTGFWIG